MYKCLIHVMHLIMIIIIVFAFLLGDIVDLNQHQLHVILLEAARLQEAPEDFLGNMYVRICEEMYNKLLYSFTAVPTRVQVLSHPY